MIVEGRCAVETPSAGQAEGLVAASNAKYGYAPPVDAYLQGVWALRLERAMAWTELTVDATRFLFVWSYASTRLAVPDRRRTL